MRYNFGVDSSQQRCADTTITEYASCGKEANAVDEIRGARWTSSKPSALYDLSDDDLYTTTESVGALSLEAVKDNEEYSYVASTFARQKPAPVKPKRRFSGSVDSSISGKEECETDVTNPSPGGIKNHYVDENKLERIVPGSNHQPEGKCAKVPHTSHHQPSVKSYIIILPSEIDLGVAVAAG